MNVFNLIRVENLLKICITTSLILLFSFFALQTSLALTQRDRLQVSVDTPTGYLGKTVTANVTLRAHENISGIIIALYVDENLIGSKYVGELDANETKMISFDFKVPEDSYVGEHYLRLRLVYTYGTENYEESKYCSFQVYAYEPPLPLNEIFILLFIACIIFPAGNELSDKFFRRCVLKQFEIEQQLRRIINQSILSAFPVLFTIFIFCLGITKIVIGRMLSAVMSTALFFIVVLLWSVVSIRYDAVNKILATRYLIYSFIATSCTIISIFISILYAHLCS